MISTTTRGTPAATHTLITANTAAILSAVPVEPEKLATGLLFSSREATLIKLSFEAGQVMTEHSAAKPILVQVISGHITFSVDGETIDMPAGAIVHVASRVPHTLQAHTESHILLTLCGAAPVRTGTVTPPTAA